MYLCVGNNYELCKNGGTDRDAVWLWTQVGQNNSVLDGATWRIRLNSGCRCCYSEIWVVGSCQCKFSTWPAACRSPAKILPTEWAWPGRWRCIVGLIDCTQQSCTHTHGDIQPSTNLYNPRAPVRCYKVTFTVSFPILVTEHWSRSWSQWTGSQPAGDFKPSTR